MHCARHKTNDAQHKSSSSLALSVASIFRNVRALACAQHQRSKVRRRRCGVSGDGFETECGHKMCTSAMRKAASTRSPRRPRSPVRLARSADASERNHTAPEHIVKICLPLLHAQVNNVVVVLCIENMYVYRCICVCLFVHAPSRVCTYCVLNTRARDRCVHLKHIKINSRVRLRVSFRVVVSFTRA